MRTIWHSLAWREWHEHKWKLAAITAVLWGVAAFALSTDGVRDRLDTLVPMASMCLIPLGVFVGLGSAASERSRGTLAFTQSLPVPMWRVAAWKLVSGLATLATPVVLGVAVLYAATLIPVLGANIQQSVERSSDRTVTGSVLVDIGIFCTAFALSFYIWATAWGVNRRDEVSAAAIAIPVMVGWGMMLGVGWYLVFWLALGGSTVPGSISNFISTMMIATVPGGFAVAVDSRNSTGEVVIICGIAVIVHAILLARYLSRFGRVASLEVTSPKAAHEEVAGAWLNEPRKSAFSAIAWKQFRESVPLALVGLAGAAACTLAFMVSDELLYLSHPEEFAKMFAGTSVVMGFFVAVVVGIGVCLNDVSPNINAFWRSRPINADLWFWTKFGTGLGVLLASVYVPVLIVVFMLHPEPLTFLFDPDSLVMPVVQIAVFAAAVMTTSLVRQAVYAAILSLATVYLGVICGLLLWWTAGQIGWVTLDYRHPLEPESNLPAALGLVLSTLVSTILAWLAVRNDWGRKSRY